MFNKLFAPIKNELKSFSIKERKFFFLILPCLFLITAEYGVTRPISNSLFITYFSTSYFPYVWLATVPLNFIIVYLYNRFLPHMGCVKIFFISSLCISFLNILTGMFVQKFPYLIFIQYAFKDVYILLILKQAWSLVHTTIKKDRAKYLYGLFFAMGSFGALLGNLVPGFFAIKFGSHTLFYFTFIFYTAIFIFYYLSTKHSDLPKTNEDFKKCMFKEYKEEGEESKTGFALFKRSKFLVFILLLVVFMQLSVALMYYQFNFYLEQAFPTADLRSEFSGKLQGAINAVAMIFQLVGGFFLVHFLGLKKCHILVPFSFLLNGLLFFFKPAFSMASYFYAYIKATDFCFFALIREMLFLPLSLDEKYRAKAIIDVFAYRTARAGASLLLLTLQFFSINIVTTLTVVNLFVFCLWILMVYKMFQTQSFETTSEQVKNV